jgi:hypothetical protein
VWVDDLGHAVIVRVEGGANAWVASRDHGTVAMNQCAVDGGQSAAVVLLADRVSDATGVSIAVAGRSRGIVVVGVPRGHVRPAAVRIV